MKRLITYWLLGLLTLALGTFALQGLVEWRGSAGVVVESTDIDLGRVPGKHAHRIVVYVTNRGRRAAEIVGLTEC